MSGGVDSSVAAALLVQRGYSVEGGFMKNFSAESYQGIIESDCPWEEDQKDAESVCKKLQIPFKSYNFEKEYREKIISYFFREYSAGRTPNPDVLCNKVIKFGIFLDKAKGMGFDYIATGHYARIQKKNSCFQLLKGVDEKKDQSYFLYALTQDQLSQSLFPIGEYQKSEVRKMAQMLGLPNAEKKDSQGLCFIGHVNLKKFLQLRIAPKQGNIRDENGAIIGTHNGVASYTIGQRKGIEVGGGPALYVAKKDMKKNELMVVRGRDNPHLYEKKLIVKQLHWICKEKKAPLSCTAKIRYQQDNQKCTITTINSSRVAVLFDAPQFAPSSGQSVVFYDGDTVLGGGIIA